MSPVFKTHRNARQFVARLRRIGIEESDIYSRLIDGGYTLLEVDNIMQSVPYHFNSIQRNDLLSFWLILHKIILIPSIFLLSLIACNMFSYRGVDYYFILLPVDALLQLLCIEVLWRNNLTGFYGLIILFALRFMLAPQLNFIDVIFLCVAVFTSKSNIVVGKAKRKRKVKV